MIWLIPLLIIGAVAASSRSEASEREFFERKIAEEKARIRAIEQAQAEAAAKAEAAKQLGQQYLAMKPTVTAGRYQQRYDIPDLNGEDERHL